MDVFTWKCIWMCLPGNVYGCVYLEMYIDVFTWKCICIDVFTWKCICMCLPGNVYECVYLEMYMDVFEVSMDNESVTPWQNQLI